ncbi:nicotinate (nicotinamide) nucleotide adenylyltransferase [Alicyclobacillus hesperidum URH17-3-68]|uniref:Probable nicotinate-nucleotide adenylyltransferase n=1 Tax=Alicyclobacillus hesperidum TaxID=89784 RepID=A0A1H2UB61_9BACL|nr:nicotinate (nicotinamide) nucleotide adenylyltransferase [Alicyclobacillus hesperidum]EJY57024.1 nicotinate (nicotinamide) nucleotide adenylyltransferase [Alicyclobacillus hesperidum URH17-3-68]GLV14159.1 nicotinate-nucleotide adenylyltransferase [Alicyclobacillus hesperidum]SDW53432.1 nicotinate-nucleotide adenylyltransferase [Alicyclobacillus hesperidum]
MNRENGVWYTESDLNRSQTKPLPATSAKKVLLFGGTFDPPHVGHLTMAQLAYEQTGVDEVWFLPAPSPPHKADIADDTFAWRVAMVSALLHDRPHLRTMPLEARLPRPSYTIDTVKACKKWYAGVDFMFLLGADSLAHLPTWSGATALCSLIPFVVAAREGYPIAQTMAKVRKALPNLQVGVIEMPLLDVSSTWLRERLDRGQDTCELVPERVLDVWWQGPNGVAKDGGDQA